MGLVGVRTAILLSVVPGLLAVAAILYAIRHTGLPRRAQHQPIRLRIRPVMRGELGRLFGAIALFEVGNIAATFFILRATDLLEPGRTTDSAAQIAIALYALYNLAATLASVPAGQLADRATPRRVLAVGVAIFAVAYVAFAVTGASVVVLAVAFIAAGVGIGAVETAEHSAVATLAEESLRGSSFGALAAIQSFGNVAASGIAGLLYTTVSPEAAFLFPATAMTLAAFSLVLMRR